MGGDNFSIGVICSSIAMADSIKRVTENTEQEVQICMSAGLDEAIPIGKRLEKDGIEVIIGRRGSALLLREALLIPVLSFPVSSLDIIVSLREAVKYGDVILLPTFRKRITGLSILEEIFSIRLVQEIYHDSASLEDLIASQRGLGVYVVIGGGVSMRFSRKYGIRGVEFQLSHEVVSSTVEDAKSIAKFNRKEQEKTARYQCIIDATSDGILSVDEQGQITTMNRAAKEIFKIKNNTIEPFLNQSLPSATVNKVISTEVAEFNKIEKINGELFVTSHTPIHNSNRTVGVVSTYRHAANVVRAEKEVRRSFAKGLIAKYFIEDFIFSSALIQDVIRKVKRFAPSDSTILITGETGTGKEILSHSIHNLSLRQKGSFVSINCAALPDQLLESELFGYEEGAFTGSKRGGKTGLFELAHGGSLFLDEIAASPLSVQSRLLRVLQEKEVMRIGSDRLIPIDVRIIAAANKNLREEVLSGRLREDLFFRLNILNIYIPPLRERIEDLPVLVEALLDKLSIKYSIPKFSVPYSSMLMLMAYSWPGNVRQLENFLEKLLLLSDNKFNQSIFHNLFHEMTSFTESQNIQHEEQVFDANTSYADQEKQNQEKIIRRALEDAQYSRTIAAEKLGISRTTLWRKIKQLGLI